MPELKRYSLIRPTVQTHFHIDFEWWSQNESDWRVYLSGLLCEYHQEVFANSAENQMVDWVDLETAEVHQVDGVQHVLITHCAKQEGFISPHTTMVDAVFRVFLANGNVPMSPTELAMRLDRPAETILRTLAGGRVYRGLRPHPEN